MKHFIQGLLELFWNIKMREQKYPKYKLECGESIYQANRLKAEKKTRNNKRSE